MMHESTVEPHEIASIFPWIEGDQYRTLVADIKANGLRVPIKLYEGKILDGRNRYKACREAGVEPRFETVETDDPIAYVLSLNLHHRHLTTSQRAMCAARARDWYDRQAKERKRELGRDAALRQHGKEGSGNISLTHTGQSRDHVGSVFNVSGKLVDQAGHVIKEGTPEMVKAVSDGKVKLNAANKAIKAGPDAQAEIVSAAAENKTSQVKQIHVAVVNSGSDGATCDEIEQALGIPHQSCAARLSELERCGWIVRTDAFRNTRTGSDASVYRAATDAERKERRKAHDNNGLIEGVSNGVGIRRANEAIDVLKRIPRNDKLREAGFAMVAKWIRVNK